jgi:hypothetical protein
VRTLDDVRLIDASARRFAARLARELQSKVL